MQVFSKQLKGCQPAGTLASLAPVFLLGIYSVTLVFAVRNGLTLGAAYRCDSKVEEQNLLEFIVELQKHILFQLKKQKKPCKCVMCC